MRRTAARTTESILAALALWLIGCATQVSNADDGGTCTIPAEATTAPDAFVVGCVPMPPFQVCEGDSPATATCTLLCKTGQYALECYDADPDPSLGCVNSGIPGTAAITVYCCPCGA